jgi:hypothetical protein
MVRAKWLQRRVNLSNSSLVELRDANLPGYELGSRGIELSRQLQNNGKKGIRRCYKSVARIRLMKTEDPSMCATVNCKLCRSAIAS